MELRKLKDKASEAFSKGRFSQAAELYEDYCRAEPKDHQSRLRTGDAWGKAGQKDRAVSAYQAAAEGFAREGFLPRAIAASKRILELDPAHRGVQQMLADLYALRGTPMGPRPHGALSRPASVLEQPVASAPAVRPSPLEHVPESGARAAAPAPLEAGGAKVDLSAELPQELALLGATDDGVRGGEEIIHSVHVGLAADEGTPALELTIEVEPAVPPVSSEEGRGAGGATGVGTGSALQAAISEAVTQTQGAPPLTQMAVREPVLPPLATRIPAVQPGGARAATSALPPGLAPRSSQRVPSVAGMGRTVSNSGRWQALASPINSQVPVSPVPSVTDAPAPIGSQAPVLAGPAVPEAAASIGSQVPVSPVPSMTEAPAPIGSQAPVPTGPLAPGAAAPQQARKPLAGAPAPVTPGPSAPDAAPTGLRARRAEPPPAPGATALPGHDLTSALSASLRTPASASAFTELELEADSLLHAVELAAQAGLGRAVGAAENLEEEVYGLAEETAPDASALEALPTIPLFSDLPREAFIELFERCPLRRFDVGERIIEQGSRGDAFYVICEGAARVFRMDAGQRQELATLESGTFFGEMALLSGAARTASVESAAEDTQLLEISAGVLAELSRNHPQVAQALKKFCRQRMLTNVMNTSELFRLFGRKDRRALVERFRSRDVERGTVVIRDGDVTDGLYVVLSGEVDVRKDGHLLTLLKEGDVFGEISLLQKTPATATVTATRHTTLLRLPRADFDALISSHPQILALISELTDERLRRTQSVLSETGVEEDIVLV